MVVLKTPTISVSDEIAEVRWVSGGTVFCWVLLSVGTKLLREIIK